MNNLTTKTNYLIKIALLAAISVILMYFDFPIIPAFPWLKTDASDLPALIGSFAFGPLTGVVIEALKNLLKLLVNPTTTGGVGELANFIIGSTFVGTAGMIYKFKKTRINAIIALIVGTIVLGIVGALANAYILIPLFMPNMPKNDLMKYIVQGVIPMNLIKGAGLSVITLVIYKRISVIINKENRKFKTSRPEASKKAV
ncbi:MAG TPA: ECF transporter S component [Clostridium sp.]|jgi:riboflavin transporter FmnP|nr:ECF transporter S component [Clostridia bacterium]HCW05683.1 ECF transporter S component [Clostridium sp.]